jgi:hypothetical protein
MQVMTKEELTKINDLKEGYTNSIKIIGSMMFFSLFMTVLISSSMFTKSLSKDAIFMITLVTITYSAVILFFLKNIFALIKDNRDKFKIVETNTIKKKFRFHPQLRFLPSYYLIFYNNRELKVTPKYYRSLNINDRIIVHRTPYSNILLEIEKENF